MITTSRMRYAGLMVWLLLNSIVLINALAYPLNPNRIIETWLFSLLLYHYFPKIWQVILGCSCLIILCYHPTAVLYGRPSFGIIISFLHTNTAETTEFLSSIPWQTYLSSILFALSPLCTIYLCRKMAPPHARWYYSLPALIIIGGMACATARKSYSINGFPLRIQPLEFIADIYLQPYGYFNELKKLKANINQLDQWQINQLQQPYQNYVLVIGESVRADYLHLYGFKYANTPFLDQHTNLMMDHMFSTGPFTIISLTNGLTLSHGHGVNMANNIISLAKKAGMYTSWLSNQGIFGKYDTPISEIAHHAQNVVFLKKTDFHFGYHIYDDQLLPHLKQTLAQPIKQKQLIVLHLMGSHPNPCQRLQTKPHHYVENMNSNCYIDSIKQTDDLLAQIYQQLQQTHQPFSLLYFSDHGLSHDTSSSPTTLRHGDNFYQNYQIPFVIINSDQQTLQHNPAKRSGLYLIDGLAAWLGIDSPQLPYSQSFFSHQDSANLQVLNSHRQLKSINNLKDDPLPKELQ